MSFINQKTNFLFGIVLFAVAGQHGLFADSFTVYTNEAAWQTAASNGGIDPIANVSLNASAWTQSNGPGGSIVDTSTASNGMSVSLANEMGYGPGYPPIFLNDSVKVNVAAERGNADSDAFQFGQGIYAFGGYFTAPSCHPDVFDPCLIVQANPLLNYGAVPIVDGFWGFVSNDTSQSFYLTGQCTPNYVGGGCGEALTISDLQFSTTPPQPTPEPSGLELSAIAVLAFLTLKKYKTQPR